MEWVVAILAAYGLLTTYLIAGFGQRHLKTAGLIVRLESQVRRRDMLITELELMSSEIKKDERDG